MDWNIICGVGIDLLPHLVSTIQAVVATLTIALVWTLVRISWPWHLTQVRVVARRQPDHRHWFGVNSKESRSLYSPLFSNLSPGTCVRYPLLSRTTPQIPPPTFRIQVSYFELYFVDSSNEIHALFVFDHIFIMEPYETFKLPSELFCLSSKLVDILFTSNWINKSLTSPRMRHRSIITAVQQEQQQLSH